VATRPWLRAFLELGDNAIEMIGYFRGGEGEKLRRPAHGIDRKIEESEVAQLVMIARRLLVSASRTPFRMRLPWGARSD
jgi:hypothetical protein